MAQAGMGSAQSPSSNRSAWPAILGQVLITALGLAVLSFFLFYAWLFLSDRQGPYHNTTSVADLDGDNDLDVIAVNLRQESETAYWSVITIWTNLGNGRFTASQIDLEPFLYLSAASGDLDGDLDNDIAVLSSDRLVFYMNQSGAQGGQAGTFHRIGSSFPHGPTGTPGSIVLADLNNDGGLDGFVAGCCGMFLERSDGNPGLDLPSVSWVWVNPWFPGGTPGKNAFLLPELDGLRIRDVALGDLDGDGDQDAFAALLRPKSGDGQAANRVLLNDGDGNFGDSGQRLGDIESTSVALGDLDGDGDLDALVGTSHGAMMWINQGGLQSGQPGYFAPSGGHLGSRPASSVFLADLDTDGDQDAFVAEEQSASIWWNDGQGSFSRSGLQFRYSARHSLALGDFDGDGNTDIFAAAYTETPTVWLNRGGGKLWLGSWR